MATKTYGTDEDILNTIQLGKDMFCVRRDGDLIVGTETDIGSAIRNAELNKWINQLKKS